MKNELAQTKSNESSQGVQSVEVGLALFHTLTQSGTAVGLSDLARQAGMHRAKAYRYLISLSRAGWVVQDPQTSLYSVGPAMRDMALSWLASQDPIRLAGTEAQALALSVGVTCFVAVMGQNGATAVRVCQPGQAVSISVNEGAIFDARSSATGRIFAAWGDEANRQLPAALRREIRSQGMAVVEGDHVIGINAVSAPVFDARGNLVLALTLVGPSSSLQASADGTAAQALLAVCRRMSTALGCQNG